MQTQNTEAKQRILVAAIEVIDADGDAALRITDIASRADVATGLINHHYGSRDGLVAAAQAARFAGLVRRDIEQFTALDPADITPDSVRAAIRDMCEQIASPDRAPIRMLRINALGSAHGRPELQAALSGAVTELLDEFSNLVVVAQKLGVVRVDIGPRALATVILSSPLGFIYSDMDADPVASDVMAETLYRILTGD